MAKHKVGIYEKYIKRILDFSLSLAALIVLAPLLLVLVIVGAVKMKGNPFFAQMRPGKDEKIFRLIKFRTMTDERDNDGNLLPDNIRLTKYGRFLRSTSLDELPELINILKGEMSIVGPRPQLVRDMVFMTTEQRRRHSVRQGLTGLAQISGRNDMSWESKFEYDLQYIDNITFWEDIRIIFCTMKKVLFREGISSTGMETSEDLGDYILRTQGIDNTMYFEKLNEAKNLMEAIS